MELGWRGKEVVSYDIEGIVLLRTNIDDVPTESCKYCEYCEYCSEYQITVGLSMKEMLTSRTTPLLWMPEEKTEKQKCGFVIWDHYKGLMT